MKVGIVAEDEAVAHGQGLPRILGELRDGTWQPDSSHEDIHMAVEARLIELADLLVERGVPFGSTHRAVARPVRMCEERSGNLSLLDGGEARRFHPKLPSELGEWLDPRATAEHGPSYGGSASAEIVRQVELVRASIRSGAAKTAGAPPNLYLQQGAANREQ